MPTKSLRRVCAGFRRRPPRTASAKSGAGPEPPPRSADPASGSLASSMPRKQALTFTNISPTRALSRSNLNLKFVK